MCFSAEASFAAAALLTATGTATLRMNLSRSYVFLAFVPLLFAMQQFSEGVLWLGLDANLVPFNIVQLAKKTFLIFAFLIWPIWVPFALAMAETVPWRKNVILADLGCGIILSAINLVYAITQSDISVKIINHSIQYTGTVPSQAILYPFIVIFPCFISSLRNMWIFGILVALAYGIAHYYYANSFVSVWCFFAALISVSLYKILRDNTGLQKA